MSAKVFGRTNPPLPSQVITHELQAELKELGRGHLVRSHFNGAFRQRRKITRDDATGNSERSAPVVVLVQL